MAKLKTIWVCSECGNETPKWVGKCPSCGSWDTYYEEKAQNIKARDDKSIYTDMDGKKIEVLQDIMKQIEFFGGGFVKGSLTLIGGEPGIRKINNNTSNM